MLKRSYFHTNSHTETFAPLINCVINDVLLDTIPDINQALLQLINVYKLLISDVCFFVPLKTTIFLFM